MKDTKFKLSNFDLKKLDSCEKPNIPSGRISRMGKPFKNGVNSVPTSRMNSKEALISQKSNNLSRNNNLDSGQSSRRSRIDRIKDAKTPSSNNKKLGDDSHHKRMISDYS